MTIFSKDTIFVLLLGVFAGCTPSSDDLVTTKEVSPESERKTEVITPEELEVPESVQPDTLGIRLRSFGLTSVTEIDSTFFIDLKYASTDNFLGENIYGNLKEVFLQDTVAKMLSKAHAFLKEEHPDLRMLIYDGVRPLWVQQKMWNLLDSIPVSERVKFVSNPANGSLHNFACAVDLTLCDKQGNPLDMGAGYDDMRKIAYPELESHFLESGELSKEQYQNRMILRKSMRKAGFSQLPTEWWHYNAMNRNTARGKFEIVP